jgi:hypothetical protein
MPTLKRRLPKIKKPHLAKGSGQVDSLLLVTEVSFELIKSRYFRSIHVDGAFGGISPTGNYLRMGIFNEGQPIPQKITHSIIQGNQLGPENIEKRSINNCFIREVEADLIMNFETAKLLKDWLEQQLILVEQLVASKQLDTEKNA